ncbi:luciferin 4-monooxygenase-like [Agrilus planipennis]|uniref:Luciferin 4-monooxygenase-like n=1 Tax=Agrilus planipennis TaxID=224129 RepID=A0A7F5REC1_AGRPL|nr:luciferin 4-monooxygenase-like [Agrilus planipennis]
MYIDGITHEEDKFNNFLTICIRTALHMRKEGFIPQDKVTICTFNTLNSAVPLIASFFTGVIPSTIDPTFSEDDCKHFLQMLKPKAIFVGSDSVDLIVNSLKASNLKSKIIVLGPSNDYESFDNYLAPIDGEESFEPHDAINWKDTAVILFSSGTTGKPKGICLNHSFLINSAQMKKHAKGVKVLFYSSLYWVTQVGLTIANILYGFIKVVCPRYDGPASFCRVAQDCKLQAVFLPFPYLVDVTEYCQNQNITLHLNEITMGGTPVTEKHLRLAAETFPNTRLLNCYGQTEVGPTTAYPRHENYVKLMKEKLFKLSCGKTVQGAIIKVNSN